MSGYAGVFHLGGGPIDPSWLETMTDFLAFRGPDGKQIWTTDSAGLCHTLLRTRLEHHGRPAIVSLDGNVWIAGDVRIDDRETLIAKISRGSGDLKSSSSAELVLHAYGAWGEACVEHLIGDFTFVLWDARQRRVLCARDQLGVKPLFYARLGQHLLVSNTLECIRQISVFVGDELNEQAIGDYLIAGRNLNPLTTFFKKIQRLPVAHRLIADVRGTRMERYWTLPMGEPLFYRCAADYVDHFRELLRAAVRDRLPSGPFGIFMSGGLDSPAVAATAVQLGASPTAFTSVYDQLIPDQERYYAGLVAKHLNIPIRYNVRDDEPWGWETGSVPIHTAEPIVDPLGFVAHQQYFQQISAQARVFFYGDGPDAALCYEWQSYLHYLIRRQMWGQLCRDLAHHLAVHRRVPLLSTLPRMWKRRRSNQPNWYDESFPPWLNSEFDARLRLRQRWNEIRAEVFSRHPIRPKGYASFACDFPMGADGGNGGCIGEPAVEHLHPLWDVRLLCFLLTVPAVPWCRDKYLVRSALYGLVPEAVRRRPKAPLAGFPYLERARRVSQPKLPPFPQLARYVDVNKVPIWPGANRRELDYIIRVLGLHYWFAGL